MKLYLNNECLYGYLRSYNTSGHADKLNTARSPKQAYSAYIYIHIYVYLYKYLCIVALKPLYMLLVKDTKHIWKSHINTLFRYLQRLKIKCKKLCKEYIIKQLFFINNYIQNA